MAEQETSLSVGSRGEVVKELQKWLNQFTSASIKEDGRYGQKTSQAVANFQRESGIEEDGIAGVNTIESIISYEGEGNEEEENEETVQGAEEEVTPTAQEEPEEEVTPEEEAEFEEPTQAPVAPEQDTTPEVTPEEEAEFAAPEGEDPTLSQQPQDTTVSQEPVPAGQVGDQQADPALQPEQPSPEDLATAARYASYANRPTPAPAPTPEPAPEVPPEIPQATQQIQQQTAGNYQKFHKPAQASTNPAVNTITPADFDHGMSPQAKKSEPQAQPSTDPATNTITPEEVPVQPYQSRDMFRQDLNSAFILFNKMVTANNHEGMDQLQAQLQNIQQRVQGQEQQYPKLSNYLNQLTKNATKWATYAESEIKFRPILTEKGILDTVTGWFGGDDEPNADIPKDIINKLLDSISTQYLQPPEQQIKQAKSQGGKKVTWTGETIHYYNPGLELFKQNIKSQYHQFLQYEKALSHQKNWSDDVVRHHSMLKKLFKQFPGIEEYDWDFEGLLTKLPPIIEKGEQISEYGLSTIMHTVETLNRDNRTSAIDSWTEATEYYNENYEKQGSEEVRDIENQDIDAKAAELRKKTKTLNHLRDEVLPKLQAYKQDTSGVEAQIKELEAWFVKTGNQNKLKVDKAHSINDEKLAKIAAEKEEFEKSGKANQQKLEFEQLGTLIQDIEDGNLPTTSVAKADTKDDIDVEAEEAKLTEELKEIGDNAIAIISDMLQKINYTEEDAPSEGPKREQFLAIGEIIAKLDNGIGVFQQSYNHQELITLETDFKQLREQVSNYLT